MTDTTEGQEQEQEQVDREQAEADAAQAKSHEVEARKMGWRPEKEWDDQGGGTWLDAGEYIERNERLAHRGNKILKAEISTLNRKMHSMAKTIEDSVDYMRKADARAYKKALKDLEVKADKAVEEGDTDAYRAVKGEIKDLAQEVKDESKPTPTVNQSDPVFDTWIIDNAWYDAREETSFDPEMAGFAKTVGQEIGHLQLSNEAFLNRILSEVKKKFPDRFGNQRRKQPQTVEASTGGGGGNGKSLWSEVPKGDQAQFKRDVANGLFEDTKADREKYADYYING